MKMLIFPILMILLAGCSKELEQPPEEEKFSPENIALGMPYTFSEAPNFTICTDKGDTKQLTDGLYCQHANPEGGFYFWTQKGSVGWKKLRTPVEITLDLGEVRPISGVSLRTAAGKDCVLWPGALEIFVSNDNSKFYYVTDLTETKRYSFPFRENVYGIHNYKNEKLKTKGRYVMFRCFPAGNYFFCDEIEVYSGPEEYLKLKTPGREVTGAFLEQLLITKGMKNRMFSDIIAIEKMDIKLKEKLGDKNPGKIRAKLQSLWNEVYKYEFRSEPETITAVVPLNGLHERIIAVHSDILNLKGFKGILLRHKDRYEKISLFDEPAEDPPSVKARLMNGECRADTLNISNCTREASRISFRVKGLPAPDVMKVYNVCGVDTREKIVDFSALVELKDKNGLYEVNAPAGMTTQLWFAFNPRSVKPGVYEGEIEFSSLEWKDKAPLSLTVSPIAFPEKNGLKTIMWDYLYPPQYGISDQNAPEAAKLMKDHFVNVATAGLAVAAFPTEKDVDPQGNIVRKLDFSAFDKWIERRPDAAVYHIYLEQSSDKAFAGKRAGTPEFERAVSQWTREIAAHAASKGIKPSHLQFNILDEPAAPADYKFLGFWAKAVKSVQTGIVIFCSPSMMTNDEFLKYSQETLNLMDVVCVRLDEYLSVIPQDVRKYLTLRAEKGMELWFYMYPEGGGVRFFDPAYYRLQPYQAFANKAIGSGFWSLADIGSAKTSWNPYLMPSGFNYSPVYITPSSITTAKQFEALREGIEDYQYLTMLRQANDYDYAWNLATSVITRAVRKGGNSYWLKWEESYSACTAAEKARLEMLNRLEKKQAK